MSFYPLLQRFTLFYITPAARYFRAFIGVMIAPFLLIAMIGHSLNTLEHPGLFWGGYTVSLLMLAALGAGSQMFSRNAYQGKGLSISPTYKSKGWA